MQYNKHSGKRGKHDQQNRRKPDQGERHQDPQVSIQLSITIIISHCQVIRYVKFFQILLRLCAAGLINISAFFCCARGSGIYPCRPAFCTRDKTQYAHRRQQAYDLIPSYCGKNIFHNAKSFSHHLFRFVS